MATASISLISGDLTGDPLNLNSTATLTKAATSTALDQFTGVSTVYYAAATTAACIALADTGSTVLGYADTTVAHKVYIKNCSPGATDFVNVEIDTTSIGRLYPGDWCFFPWDGTNNVDIDTSAAGMTVEYAVLSQSAAS